ncbi:putative flavin containing polyamine oxidase [Aspergillus brunneoviolaceus CBS 621.78]|uniref:Flavin-containing polyamine oxidase n=1 Tax=Aspergillus brunneoviolaceus CBS 621.78 TaxID=1450534 RepID=A0ACD1GIM3_9EURO|nr:flavin-containing polyamine oxidase [Aspergillus brunneoviolaceus CBS 621.78]RAH48931.1 flavin-containing polyamine oxidase [Aspergillus brunneoviolaceus CBS 621.78]
MHSHSNLLNSLTFLLATIGAQPGSAYVAQTPLTGDTCTQTTVAILGGGMAGVAAAQALTNASVADFVLVESRETLGGRVWHTDFGKDKDGNPYVVEFGANWLQGLGSADTVNPVWALAKKHHLRNTYSNYSSLRTYNETGEADYQYLLDEYARVYEIAARDAGRILMENLQDQTARTGLALAGWRPRKNDMAAQAVEWWNWDWEDASPPETSSFVFGMAGENLTFNQFGKANHFVLDRRGYSTIIEQEAAAIFRHRRNKPSPRLRLNTHVTTIDHSPIGVTIHTADGACIEAAYAICTFSLGVLQNHAVSFRPPLPRWKQTAIEKFNMGTYTKIFLQFPHTFWPTDTQFFLYASPTTRGYYPIFQSLSSPTFLPDSHILVVTVVDEQAYRVERQSTAQTTAEILEVLREMFPTTPIPHPTDVSYPRWSQEPWAYGSYSNWPAGTTLEMHQNLRANAGRLWFAGEATSAPYFGFLHGAWFEGREAGAHVAALLQGRCMELRGSGHEGRENCGERMHYEPLNGTTPLEAYSMVNGWPVSSTDW